jgi:TonB family protein
VAARPVVRPTTTTLPEPPPPGILHVESQPTGATVTLNGAERGVTPIDIPELPLASYEVTLEMKGYEPKSESVTLTAEAPRSELSLTLARQGPAMGTAEFLSTPLGATVRVDGVVAGQTPVTDYRLKAGNHHVEISKDGYMPFAGALRVDAGKKARTDATLTAMPKAAPSPSVEAVDTSKVYDSANVDTPPKKTSGTSASYPDNAPRLKSGDAGVSCAVSYVVDESGQVTDLKIEQSAGKVVDEAVLAAVKTWKYTPAVKRGVKVKVRMAFKQTFRAG